MHPHNIRVSVRYRGASALDCEDAAMHALLLLVIKKLAISSNSTLTVHDTAISLQPSIHSLMRTLDQHSAALPSHMGFF